MSKRNLLASVSQVAMAKQLVIREWDAAQAAQEQRRRLAAEGGVSFHETDQGLVVIGATDES